MNNFFSKILIIPLYFLISPMVLLAQRDADPLTQNVPISFYGRVESHDGRPLAGAKVTLEIHAGRVNPPAQVIIKKEPYVLQTDANGQFALTDKDGHSVTVLAIEKTGYELSSKATRMYSYSASSVIFHPDSNNPVVFKMWAKQGAEKLSRSAWHGNVRCDGTLLSFDLSSGKPSKNGELHITCTRVPLDILPREHKRYDYSLRVEVLNGGILSTEDEFTYLAPESGYLPSITLGAKADDPKWIGNVKQEFYIRTADGHYGKLSVDWYADLAAPTHLEWDCVINPSGSHNLER